MADVGDIHDVFYGITMILQHPAEDIFEDVGAQIANMRIVIDGWAAGVETHFSCFYWGKGLNRPRGGVVQFELWLVHGSDYSMRLEGGTTREHPTARRKQVYLNSVNLVPSLVAPSK